MSKYENMPNIRAYNWKGKGSDKGIFYEVELTPASVDAIMESLAAISPEMVAENKKIKFLKEFEKELGKVILHDPGS